MIKKNEPASFTEMSKLIVDAIQDEPFFNKETLIPKIKAIMSAFNLKLIQVKLDSVVTDTDKTRFLKELNKREFERRYWMNIVRKNMPDKINYITKN